MNCAVCELYLDKVVRNSNTWYVYTWNYMFGLASKNHERGEVRWGIDQTGAMMGWSLLKLVDGTQTSLLTLHTCRDVYLLNKKGRKNTLNQQMWVRLFLAAHSDWKKKKIWLFRSSTRKRSYVCNSALPSQLVAVPEQAESSLSSSLYPAQNANAWDTNAFKQRAPQFTRFGRKAGLSVPQFKSAQSFSVYLTGYHQVGNPAR